MIGERRAQHYGVACPARSGEVRRDRMAFDEDGETLVAHVRPRARARGRCAGVPARGMTGMRAGGAGGRWTGGLFRAFVEADSPRSPAPSTGSWSRTCRGRVTTRGTPSLFDDMVAWLATRTSTSTLEGLLRSAWRTVGAIVARVFAEGGGGAGPVGGAGPDRDRRDQ